MEDTLKLAEEASTGRIQWLRYLAEGGTKPRGSAGFYCRRDGLSEFKYFKDSDTFGMEVLTDKGREVLRLYNENLSKDLGLGSELVWQESLHLGKKRLVSITPFGWYVIEYSLSAFRNDFGQDHDPGYELTGPGIGVPQVFTSAKKAKKWAGKFFSEKIGESLKCLR